MDMGSWQEFKKAWDIGDNFPLPSERVLSAFSIIREQIGHDWFKQKKKSGLGKSLIVLEAVRLAEAIAASKEAGARKLERKLLLDGEKEEFNRALDEADVLVKLLPWSDKIDYEPEIEGISRKPDLLQHIGKSKVQYEVFSPEISAEEEERNKKLKELAEELGSVFRAGALDVYLLDPDLTVDSKVTILDKVRKLNDNVNYVEIELTGTAVLVFDPRGGVTAEHQIDEEKKIQSNGKVVGGSFFDYEKDRSQVYRKKYGLKHRSPGLIVFSKANEANAFTNFKLLRLFRPALDKRVFLKVIHESSQLASTLPSIVVVVMGRPTALIEDWADIVVDAFRSGHYTHPAGVWLRELHWGPSIYNWREIFVFNHYSTINIPQEVVTGIVGEEAVRKFE